MQPPDTLKCVPICHSIIQKKHMNKAAAPLDYNDEDAPTTANPRFDQVLDVRLSRRNMRMLSDGLRHAISFGGTVRAMIVLMITVIIFGVVARVSMLVRGRHRLGAVLLAPSKIVEEMMNPMRRG